MNQVQSTPYLVIEMVCRQGIVMPVFATRCSLVRREGCASLLFASELGGKKSQWLRIILINFPRPEDWGSERTV